MGPSVSTFFFSSSATGFVADLATFYDTLKARLPSTLSVDIPASGDTIDEVTGSLTGTWTDGTDTVVGGTGSAVFALGVGVRVVWLTNGINNGRRIRGTTFMVPVDATVFSTDGTMGTPRSEFISAAAALVTATSGDMRIWTRPVNGAGGGSVSVIGSTVPDTPTTLRSRRV